MTKIPLRQDTQDMPNLRCVINILYDCKNNHAKYANLTKNRLETTINM